jgi:hypothetical protein
MELYKFKNLQKKLNEDGYQEVLESRFEIVKKDFTQEEAKGNITFKNDGIYLKINGDDQKGYMYIKTADIDQYGFPKFHTSNCQVITTQKNQNRFQNHYFWSNSNKVDIKQRGSTVIHKDVNLQLCGYCRNAANINNYSDTNGFFNLLDIQTPTTNRNRDVELDIYGYTKDWQFISKLYRTKMNFTCENCSIKINDNYDKRFLEVHHKNGDKLNNSDSNIECLCVLCHSNEDKKHQENFSKKNNQIKIKSFVERYKNDLLECNNSYLIDYLIRYPDSADLQLR